MFTAGWAKQEILIEPKGLAMFGYGQWTHRAYQKRTALFARSICIYNVPDQTWLIFCCLDLGCVTSAMRLGAIEQLTACLGASFDAQALILTATHTHSGPGGCAFEVLYNLPTPGFVPEHVEEIVKAIVLSVQAAIAKSKAVDLKITQGTFAADVDVAWNRSLSAYNLNPEVKALPPYQTHLALDREMKLLGIYENNKIQAVLSLFGVHATCLGNTLHAYDADNKGYAAVDLEQRLKQHGADDPVAIFAQGTAGDVSPHYHGDKQLKVRKKIKGEREYQYARQNGLRQSQLALNSLHNKASHLLQGEVKAILNYVDLPKVKINPCFSANQADAQTTIPCFGAAFFAGTPVDGLGAAKPVVMLMQVGADYVRYQRLKKASSRYQLLYKAQGNKKIVLEAEPKKVLGKSFEHLPRHVDKLVTEMQRQYHAGAMQESLLVPEILPIQLIRLGQLVVVCCPGEITTIAGKRLKQAVQQQLNDPSLQVWLCSYCNDYMGYITTQQEYQKQNYEGGHTLYGQWTLAAFQTVFSELAQQWHLPSEQQLQRLQPALPTEHELKLRTQRGHP